MNAKELKLELRGVVDHNWVYSKSEGGANRKVIILGKPKLGVLESEYLSLKDKLPKTVTTHTYKTDSWVREVQVIVPLYDLCHIVSISTIVTMIDYHMAVESVLLEPEKISGQRGVFYRISPPEDTIAEWESKNLDGYVVVRSKLELFPNYPYDGEIFQTQHASWIILDEYPDVYLDTRHFEQVESGEES